MNNCYDIIIPHLDIRQGHFDKEVFDTNLGNIYEGVAVADYNVLYLFFKKIYQTTWKACTSATKDIC